MNNNQFYDLRVRSKSQRTQKIKHELFGHEPNPSDVAQGNVGDCYFAALLIAVVSAPWGPQFIKNHMRVDENYVFVTMYIKGTKNQIYTKTEVRVKKVRFAQKGKRLTKYI
jgi:hypothetical protein